MTYLVVWQNHLDGFCEDIYGARVNQSGTVIDSFAVSLQPDHQVRPAIAHGPENQLLFVYSGWADSINTHPASAMRIWGKFYPFVGIEQEAKVLLDHPGISLQVYPNPFCDIVNINFNKAHIPECPQIKIYDVSGRIVKQFTQFSQTLGQISWDARDNLGNKLPSGVYFLEFQAENHLETRKLLLIK